MSIRTAATFISVSLILFLAACGGIRTPTEQQLELSPGGQDNSTYPFEADYGSLTTNVGTGNNSFASISLSAERSYLGNSSLKLLCDYSGTSPYTSGVIGMNNSNVVLTGKIITAHVWVPAGMFDTNNPYGMQFYVQLPGSWDWYQSSWQNLNLPSAGVPGIWNDLTISVNDLVLANGNGTAGHITNHTAAQNNADMDHQLAWGLKVAQGDFSADFSGYIYIDSFDIR